MIYLQIIYIFFKIGLFSFGGGYAMLPIIYQEVQYFNVIDQQGFFNMVAISQITPGPIAVNVATYVGYKAAGLLGSILATIAICLPCMSIVLLVSYFWVKFKESETCTALMDGIRPATIGLIGSAVLMIAQTSLMEGWTPNWGAILIFTIVLIGSFTTKKIGAIGWTIIGGLLGMVLG